MKVSLRRFVQLPLLLWFVLSASITLAQAGGSPRLRVVHAAPDAPNADVFIDDNLTFPNMGYRAITDYVNLTPGNHLIRVLPAGQPGPVIFEPTLPFVDGKDYTLLAIGTLNNIQPWQLEDDNNPPGTDKVRVRVVHAIPNAPAIDICVAGQNNCPVTNLNFKNASGYLTLDPAVYNLDVRRTGTNEVLLNAPNLNLNGGLVYTLFLMGLFQGQPGPQLIPKVDAGQPPPVPPDTGAFLSPSAIMALSGILAILVGGALFARQRFRKDLSQ